MKVQNALAELGRHQDLILDHMASACAVAAGSDPDRGAVLARRRWEMVRLLRAYQLFKHVELFDPLLRDQTLGKRDAAERLKRRCVDAGEAFAAHVRRWSGADIDANWPAYATAMAAVVDGLRTHLARERREVTALLADSGQRIRRPD